MLKAGVAERDKAWRLCALRTSRIRLSEARNVPARPPYNRPVEAENKSNHELQLHDDAAHLRNIYSVCAEARSALRRTRIEEYPTKPPPTPELMRTERTAPFKKC